MGSSYLPAPTGGPADGPPSPGDSPSEPPNPASGSGARGPAERRRAATRRRAADRLAWAALVALGGVLPLAGLGGCAASRTLVITATPGDAAISIDGVREGTGTVTARLRFPGDTTHTVVVSRLGYADQTLTLDRANPPEADVRVALKPQVKKVWFDVRPLPAIVKVDGRPVGDGAAVSRASADLSFGVDAKDNWVPHVVSAERPGYRRAERVVRFTDPSDTYGLYLESERKDVVIRTDPPGADVTIDGEPAGKSPATVRDLVIRTDPQTNEWLGRRVRVSKPGYEPAELTIRWDDKRGEYAATLGVKAKTVRVTTDPPDAVVRFNDRQLPRDPSGAVWLPLQYRPTNDQGDLPIPELTVTPPMTNPVRESAKFPIGWDDGKTDYALSLPSAPTKPTPLVRPTWAKIGDGWRLAAESVAVDAPVRTDERPGVRLARVLPPADGGTIDGLVTSPDGSMLAYAVVSTVGSASVVPGRVEGTGAELRSRLQVVAIDLPLRFSTVQMPSARPQRAAATPGGPAHGKAAATTTRIMLASAVVSSAGAGRPATSPSPATAPSPPAAAGSAHAPAWVTDGRSVAVMPSFAPDGLGVLYADSPDAGQTFGVFRTTLPASLLGPTTAPATEPANGGGGVGDATAVKPPDAVPAAAAGPRRLTAGEPADLWPTLDSAPQPRVYVRSVTKDDPVGRLAAVDPEAAGQRADLGPGGDQPRVSPRADAVVFTRPDPKTGKRDLFLLRMGENEPVNLTNSPDDDDADPAWSKDGGKLAFASDRPANGPQATTRGGGAAAGGAVVGGADSGATATPPTASAAARDRNIWVLDVGKGEKPQRVTSNPAWDDSPAWNGDGTVVYFRSNRGGEWAVWAVDLK